MIKVKDLVKKFNGFTAVDSVSFSVKKGEIFALNDLPQILKVVASLYPLSYGVDGLRGTLINGSHFGLGVDFVVLSLLTMIFLGIGSYLFSKIEV